MMPRSYDSNYYRYRVRNFNPFNKSRSRRCTRSWIVVAAGRLRQLYCSELNTRFPNRLHGPAGCISPPLCVSLPTATATETAIEIDVIVLSIRSFYLHSVSINLFETNFFFPHRSQPIIEDIDLLVFEKKNFLITIRIIYCAVCTMDM